MANTPKNKAGVAPAYGGDVQRFMIELNVPATTTGLGMALQDDAYDLVGEILASAGATRVSGFVPVHLPAVSGQDAMQSDFNNRSRFEASFAPEDQTLILAATCSADQAQQLAKKPEVAGVYADPQIEPCIICPGSAPLGGTIDVARLLCAEKLRRNGMDGRGVLLAIVDTGINKAHLAARGLVPAIDIARSWVPVGGMLPFEAPVGHGTMCAFDALIAAPGATLLDVQLLRSTAGGGFGGFLSDAVRAYAHLQSVMRADRRPGEARSLVVNNSWGMFHPSWDFPVGHPGNYSDNPNHPFNRSVAALETLGADILFAAGNCGADCPDGRCQGVTANAIYGANGHSAVLTVAGVDTTKIRVGYSSQGPGRLSRNKPDIAGFTHFSGSGVYAADGGTSAACPVVAGVVAAVRTRKPHQPGNPAVSPHAIREMLRSTAEDISPTGFDFNTGFGIVNGCGLVDRIVGPTIPGDIRSICERYPMLCRPPRGFPSDFCRRFPRLCRPEIPVPPFPRPGFESDTEAFYAGSDGADEPMLEEVLAAMWQMGYEAADSAMPATKAPSIQKCDCN